MPERSAFAAGVGDPDRDRQQIRALIDPDNSFPARLAADRDALVALSNHLWSQPTVLRAPRLADLERLVHRLGGAAGTFGFDEVGEAALELDDRLVARREAGRALHHCPEVANCLDRLAAALDRAVRQR